MTIPMRVHRLSQNDESVFDIHESTASQYIVLVESLRD